MKLFSFRQSPMEDFGYDDSNPSPAGSASTPGSVNPHTPAYNDDTPGTHIISNLTYQESLYRVQINWFVTQCHGYCF